MPTMKNRLAEMNAAEKKKPHESSFVSSAKEHVKSHPEYKPKEETKVVSNSKPGTIPRVEKALREAGA